jgi:hypothetical protein
MADQERERDFAEGEEREPHGPSRDFAEGQEKPAPEGDQPQKRRRDRPAGG